MPSKHNPADSIADIVENTDRVAMYIAGIDRDGLAQNALVRDAVELCIERICEAAHTLGDDANRLMPAQIWRDISGMRKKLRNAYDQMNGAIHMERR